MPQPWFGLARYAQGDVPASAIVLDGALYDLAAAVAATGSSLDGASSTQALLNDWDAAYPALAAIAAKLPATGLAPVDATPLAPFEPRRLFCTASNYVDHAREMETALAAKAQSRPYVFLKSTDAVIGHKDEVVIPHEVTQPDWEVELGVVIGRPGKRIALENARDHIAGYVVFNDVSARNMIQRTDYPFKHDWFGCKSYDTFAPIGPWLVPDACIEDPHALALQLDVNDVRMQDGSSAEMIFNIFELIAYLSTLGTLHAGDVIATGTPAGVGKGRGIFLKPGDTMHAAIEHIGMLSNPVVAEG